MTRCTTTSFGSGGDAWVYYTITQNDNTGRDQACSANNLVIPTKKDGAQYNVADMLAEQKSIVYSAVDTVVKFITNDPAYKPM